MTIILCLAAVAGAVSLYARGSQFLGWDSTWSKILVSGCAAAILAFATVPVWWAAVLVVCGTAAGHAGWTGHIFGKWGDHDEVFPLVDPRPDTLRAWVGGCVTGAQITAPFAILQLVTGAYTLAGVVLIAGMLKPACYAIGGRFKSAPLAEGLHAGAAWAAMLAAALAAQG